MLDLIRASGISGPVLGLEPASAYVGSVLYETRRKR